MKVLIRKESTGLIAIFLEESATIDGDLICYSENDGLSYCSRSYVRKHTKPVSGEDEKSMLELLKFAGHENIEVVYILKFPKKIKAYSK